MIRHLLAWPLHRGQNGNRSKVFEHIRKTNFWRGGESISGPGSSMASTSMLRAVLPDFLREYAVKRFLDVPCGDFNWMQSLNLDGIDYMGGDLLGSLVKQNRRRYGNANRRFELIDLCEGPLPQADMLMARDCLGHLSYAEIESAMSTIRRSGIPFVLITHFTGDIRNEDIPTGRWRPLNFTRPPFNLPPPLRVLADGWAGGDAIYAQKTLALWRTADLPLSFRLGAVHSGHTGP